MSEWKSIDTAPRDGTDIIIGHWARNKWLWLEDTFWLPEDEDQWFLSPDNHEASQSFPPTHWMPLLPPLPVPPSIEG